MQIHTTALTFLALAASTGAFAPKPAVRNSVAVNLGGIDLPSIEDEVSRRFVWQVLDCRHFHHFH
jgi:hypothetical protein